MDFRPVLSPHAAISYISKYVSKAETQSKSYQDILRTVVGQSNDNARVAVVYQKMLSSFVGERDISGEYLIYPLLITPNRFQHRKFVTLYLGVQCGSLPGNIALSKFLKGPLMRLHLSNAQILSPSTNVMLYVLMNLKTSPSMNSISGMMLRVTSTKGVVHVEQNHM
jgi:hypothetical protein